MARNVRVVTGGYAPQDRATALADALTVRALKSRTPPQGGPVQVAMSPWEGVAQLGEATVAALMSNKVNKLAEADQARKLAANDAMIRQLAGEKAPRRLNEQGQPVGPEVQMPTDLEGRPMMLSDKAEQLSAAMAGMDPAQGNQVLSGAVLQKALAGPAALKEVDLGDRIGLMDPSTGQIVRELPKRATPDTALREQGSDRRHATASGSAQLSAQTTMRGQDIGANTAMRGQDLTYGAATRGQDMTAATARRGQDLTTGGAASVSDANPMGLTGRQPSGLKTQENAVLNYAANLSGKTRAEIDAIYAAEGAAGVSRVMKENGNRFVQGRTAMAIGAIPLIGDTLVNMANPDVAAPVAAGSAGVAAFNNSTGPITNSDIIMGKMQMPQPEYPLENQAQIVEQILSQAQQAFPNRQMQSGATMPAFATEAEAAAAGIPPGTRVVIGGVPGTWQ